MNNLEASLGLRVVRNRWWIVVATVTIVAANSGDRIPGSNYWLAGQIAWIGILSPEFLEILQRTAYEMMDIERDELTTDTRQPTDMQTASSKLAAAVAVNNAADNKRYIEAANRPDAASAEIHLAIEPAKVIRNRAREFVDEATAEFSAETAAENQICSSGPGEAKCPN